MSTRVVDRVEDWDKRSFTGGYRKLHELADSEFSGVVRAGGAELYMTKGVAVGVRQGDIEDFEDGQGTVYESPSPALPLLTIMQEEGDGNARDQFYTEKTAISEVDSTLADGGFTGYIELSENVLSGDYYLVYQAGRSMSVGFVGESSRLIDGDEAFETADDEVGIYKVHAVDFEPIEIPEADEPAGTTGGSGRDTGTEPTAAAGGPATPAAGASDDEPTGGDATASQSTQQDSRGTTDRQQAGRATDTMGAASDTATQASEAESGQQETGQERGQQDAERGGAQQADQGRDRQGNRSRNQQTSQQRNQQADQGHGQQASQGERQQGAGREDNQEPGRTESARSEQATPRTEPQEPTPDSREPATGSRERATGPSQGTRTDTGTQRRTEQQSDWDQEAARGRAPAEGGRSSGVDEGLDLEQRAIPSLDPDRTSESEGSARDSLERSRGGSQSSQGGQPQQAEPEPRQSEQGAPAAHDRASAGAGGRQREPAQPQEQTTQPQETQQPTGRKQQETANQPAVDPERIESPEDDLDEAEAEINRLEDELASATTERDELREQLESVQAERDELQQEVDRLNEELGRLEEELGAATDAERRITSEEALSGTDIFVRYHSKGDATLEKAHGGSTRKEEVNDNLRLEKHTQFDADSVAVGGQSYAEYLEQTVEYQFVEWLVRELLFEIRETGHQKELKDLYDVLPAVDRAELAGVVDVVYTADGQETRSQEGFDIILRDRMGNPLLVANLNDSREAATEMMMEDLITAAERVGQSSEQFAGALLVTRSFFDPGALEVAEEATQGGLLSRDKRTSFVNLSRKRGYHLCLVEARNENFHLAVPEL